MPCGFGLCAFLNVLFYLALLPLQLLALRLEVPTRSPDEDTIYAKWTEDAGDPLTVYIQVVCPSLPISSDRVRVRVSDLRTSFEFDSTFMNVPGLAGRCRLRAFDDSTSKDRIAESDAFTTLSETETRSFTAPATSLGHHQGSDSGEIIINGQHFTPTPTFSVHSIHSPRTTGTRQPPVYSTIDTIPTISGVTETGSSSKVNPGTFPPSATSPIPTISGVMETGSSPKVSPGTFPSSVISPIPTSSAIGNGPGSVRRTPSRGALIGGIVGGLTLLVVLIVFLYRRRRRDCSSSNTATSPHQHQIIDHEDPFRDLRGTRSYVHNAAEPARVEIIPRAFLPFRRQAVQSLTVHPLEHSEDYVPPQSKRERLERVRQEMEESRRQREMLQSNLVNRSNRDIVSNGLEVGLDGEVERLGQQIEALSRRIEGLEAERQEVEAPPPDYRPFTP